MTKPHASLTRLSPALREVAVRIIAGDTNAEIARRRSTSVRTVANQVATIFEKLEVSSRRELAVKYKILVERQQPEPPNGRGLTARERQVAKLAAVGQSNKAIAYELGVAPSTVAVLLGRAAVKLGTTSRSGFVYAFDATTALARRR